MESCTCINCTGDNFHLEQMAEEVDPRWKAKEGASKDDYMENRPPSIYEKLEELSVSTSRRDNEMLIEEIQSAVNAIDNELISLALELPTEQAEKLLAIQERLY